MEMCETSLTVDFTETNGIDGLALQAVLRSISKDGNADYLFKPPSPYIKQNSVNESMECNTIYIETNEERTTNIRRLHEESEKQLENIPREKFIKPSYHKQISAISTVEELLVKQTIHDTVEELLVKQTINDTVVNMPGESSERCAYSSNESGWSRKSYGAKHRSWLQWVACIFAVSGCSCVVSVLTVAFMMLLLNRVRLVSTF